MFLLINIYFNSESLILCYPSLQIIKYDRYG